jgi:hypothetical protein
MAIFILVNLLKVNISILTCMFISILHDIVLDRIMCYCIVLTRERLAIGSRMIERIKKRDGRIVNYEPEKIGAAIATAFQAVGQARMTRLPGWRKMVADGLDEQFSEPVHGIEDVQDIAVRALIDEGYSREAKA